MNEHDMTREDDAMNNDDHRMQEIENRIAQAPRHRVPKLIDLDCYEVVDPKSGCDVETQPFASDDDPWEEYEVIDPKSGREVETQPFACVALLGPDHTLITVGRFATPRKVKGRKQTPRQKRLN
ncbi:MAG: hypothetical protein ABIK09_13405 [Pseudomonadota bacterium]